MAHACTTPCRVCVCVCVCVAQYYEGDLDEEQLWEVAYDFVAKYRAELPTSEEVETDPIDARQIVRAVRHAPRSSAAPEGIWPGDVALIPAIAAWWMAMLLNLCERLDRWPELTRYAIATPILKPEGIPEEPLDRRNIAVLPYPYRLWARCRRYVLKTKWYPR